MTRRLHILIALVAWMAAGTTTRADGPAPDDGSASIQVSVALLGVEFLDNSQRLGEEAGLYSIAVRCTAPVGAAGASVDYNATDVTAQGNGVDYRLLGSGTLQLNEGATSGTIQIQIVDDIVNEDIETVIIDLRNPVNISLGAEKSFIVDINDNDPDLEVGLTMSGVTVDEGAGLATVAIELTGGQTERFITVDYQTVAGTADENVDYDRVADSFTFVPGASRRHVVQIPIRNDSENEGEDPEKFELKIVSVEKATLVRDTTTIQIRDDEIRSDSRHWEGYR